MLGGGDALPVLQQGGPLVAKLEDARPGFMVMVAAGPMSWRVEAPAVRFWLRTDLSHDQAAHTPRTDMTHKRSVATAACTPGKCWKFKNPCGRVRITCEGNIKMKYDSANPRHTINLSRAIRP